MTKIDNYKLLTQYVYNVSEMQEPINKTSILVRVYLLAIQYVWYNSRSLLNLAPAYFNDITI